MKFVSLAINLTNSSVQSVGNEFGFKNPLMLSFLKWSYFELLEQFCADVGVKKLIFFGHNDVVKNCRRNLKLHNKLLVEFLETGSVDFYSQKAISKLPKFLDKKGTIIIDLYSIPFYSETCLNNFDNSLVSEIFVVNDTNSWIDTLNTVSHDNGNIYALRTNSVSEYYTSNLYLLRNIKLFSDDKKLHSTQIVSKGAKISKSAILKDEIFIGENVKIKDICSVGPSTIVLRGSTIGTGTQVSSSIILKNTHLGSNLEIKNKIINEDSLFSSKTGDKLELVDKFISKSNRGILPKVLSYLFNKKTKQH